MKQRKEGRKLRNEAKANEWQKIGREGGRKSLACNFDCCFCRLLPSSLSPSVAFSLSFALIENCDIAMKRCTLMINYGKFQVLFSAVRLCEPKHAPKQLHITQSEFC